jgi:HEAT repeat protein
MVIEAFVKGLIAALGKYAQKALTKKRLEKKIEQSVHKAFTAHADDLLALCNHEEFSHELFRLAEGELILPKDLVELGVASSDKSGLNFSRSKIIDELERFSITLSNIFQGIDPTAGQMPNAFSKFYDSMDRLSIAYMDTEISPDEFEALWEKMQGYNLSPEIQQLRYIGFRLTRREPPSLNLLDVFVPLEVEISESRYGSDTQASPHSGMPERVEQIEKRDIPFARLLEKEKRTETVTFSSLMADYRYITILGDPGSGKTTLLKWIAVLAALGRNRLQKEFGLNDPLLAFPVSVGQLSKIKNELGESASVFEAMAHYFKSRNIGDIDPLKAFLRLCFKEGKCLLLLDGLDEVKKVERDMIRNWLELFVSNNSNNRFLVTSRIVGYAGFQMPSNGIEVTVQPFSNEQVKSYIEEFSKAYFRWETENEESQVWRQESDRLLTALDNSPRLKDLGRNPFLLSGMALIQRAEGRLPRHRVQFYDIFARCLCETWNDARCLVASKIGCDMSFEGEAVPVLGTLAIRMTNEYPAGRASKEFVLETLTKALQATKGVGHSESRQAAQGFLDRVEKDLQLFLERGPDEWGFLHITFQEYFATAGLHSDEKFIEEALAHLFDPGWEEIIRLGVGYMAIIQTRPKAATNFIQEVLGAKWDRKPWVVDTLGLHIPLAALLCAEGGNVISRDFQCLVARDFATWIFNNDSFVSWANRILADISLTDFTDTLAQPFIEALKDEDERVRRRAAEALGKMKAEAAVPQLMEALRDEASFVRRSAVYALGAMKTEAASPSLVEALKDEDERVRRRAAEALGKMKAEAAVPQLMEALRDKDSDVRRSAAQALGAMKAEAGIPSLVEALKDKDSDVRTSAAEVLGEMKEVTVPPQIEALRNKDSFVRRSAAQALGAMKAEAAIPSLVEALKDKDTHVRTSAAQALGEMKAEAAIPSLVESLKDKDSDVRRSAAQALGAMKAEAAIPSLVEALKDEEPFVRATAISALAAIKAEAAIPPLTEALKDEDSFVRATAISELAAMKAEAGIPSLVEALSNEDSFVRVSAAQALGAMKVEAAISSLMEALKDEEPFVRASAVYTLGAMKVEAAIPLLMEALKDEELVVRRGAVHTLGAMKVEAAISSLVEALKDEEPFVRADAADALLLLV